jgi:hypothetical protein
MPVCAGTSVRAELTDDMAAIAVAGPSPNPLNPCTTLGLTLGVPVHLRVTVHDALGRRVCRIADRRIEPGQHALE